MTDEPIATLYRKPCPSCARQYARDSRACPFCGYEETAGSDQEEDQERLYGEYLIARHRQYQDEAKRLRNEAERSPNDPSRIRVLAQVDAEIAALERDLKAYHERVRPEPRTREAEPRTREAEPRTREAEPRTREAEPRTREAEPRTREVEPPERAVGDKVCPVCTATVPHVIGQCACGYVFGAEVTALSVCPHCTATVEAGVARCSCGYPLTVGASLSSIPGLSKR